MFGPSNRVAKAAILIGVCCVATKAFPIELKRVDLPGTNLVVISLTGTISAGDGIKFQKFVENIERASIILESPGGALREALHIGASIRLKKFATMVVSEKNCFSACALVWLAGERRYFSGDAKLGFHAAYYRDESGKPIESGVANAEIGSYLTHLGYRIEAIRYFTTAGPTDLQYLNASQARALGVEVFEIDSAGKIISPSDAPTLDVYAYRFVAYTLLKSVCGPYLRPAGAVLDRQVKLAFDEGQRVGGAAWTDIMLVRRQIN